MPEKIKVGLFLALRESVDQDVSMPSTSALRETTRKHVLIFILEVKNASNSRRLFREKDLLAKGYKKHFTLTYTLRQNDLASQLQKT